uniref:Uncharacterized protein n=1 Tax=viral metagenome TaxID=1070528 RepID=A0A6C0AEX0_9ZZZZ
MEINLELLDHPKYSYLKKSDFYKNLDLSSTEKIFILYICPIDETNIDLFAKTIDFWCLDSYPSSFFELVNKKIRRDVKIIYSFLESNIESLKITTNKLIYKDILFFMKKLVNLNLFHILEIIFEKFKNILQKSHFYFLIRFCIKQENIKGIDFLIKYEKIYIPEIYKKGDRLDVLLSLSVSLLKLNSLKYFHGIGVDLKAKQYFFYSDRENLKYRSLDYQKCWKYYFDVVKEN